MAGPTVGAVAVAALVAGLLAGPASADSTTVDPTTEPTVPTATTPPSTATPSTATPTTATPTTPAPTTAPTTAAPTAKPVRYVTRKITVGKSRRGRPIVAYFKGDPAAQHVVLVLGQMHGDEKAGPRTARWIVRHLRPRAGTGLWVIPTMNPDGAKRGTRTNAAGVDLNRNWPTSGWIRGTKGSRTYGGPKRASEPETRAMMRFLRRYRPDYIASIHQPLKGIGKSGKDAGFERRLAANLGLRRKHFGVRHGRGTSPTMTGWYNRTLGRHGTAITIEYGRKPSTAFVTSRAGRGILRAARL